MAETETAAQEEAPATHKDELKAVMAAAHAKAEEQADAVTAEEAPVEAAAEAEAPDEQGEGEASDAEAAAGEEAPDPDAEAAAEPADGALAAPEHWGAELTEQFNALPDEARPAVMKTVKAMEARHREKGQELAEQRKSLGQYQEIGEIFAPYEQQLAAQGLTPGAYLRQLVAVAQQAQADAPGFIRRFMQARGIDPSQLSGQAGAEDDIYVDPAVKAVQEEVSQLRSVLAGQAQQAQKSLDDANSAMKTEIQKFAAAEDAHGKKLYPHFESVRNIISSDPAMRLDVQTLTPEQAQAALKTAYENAVWTLPEAREDLMRQQEARQSKEAKAKADKAKQARTKVRSNASPTAADVADQKDMSHKDALKAVRDQLRDTSQQRI